MVNLATLHGWTFAVYSPENFPPETHLRKWAKKIVGKPFWGMRRMSREEAEQALDWAADRLDFLIPDDDSTLASVLGLARALVYRNGITGLVIDPWNNMDHERPLRLSETEYISRSLTEIRAFARQYGVHVWVLAHPMKLTKDKDGEYPVPTPYDISGSANWFNKADNILTVYRNKTEAHALVELHIQKIRFHECGQLGVCGLRWAEDTGRYIDVGEWSPVGGK
jgi:twinkle protein